MRFALLVIELVVAANALGGGVYGLAGAKGVPTELLDGTPFRDFRVPSLTLLVAVGGSMGAAAVLTVVAWPTAAAWAAIAAGAILLTWIAVQVALIGYVSCLQPLMGVLAVVAVALGAAAL